MLQKNIFYSGISLYVKCDFYQLDVPNKTNSKILIPDHSIYPKSF